MNNWLFIIPSDLWLKATREDILTNCDKRSELAKLEVFKSLFNSKTCNEYIMAKIIEGIADISILVASLTWESKAYLVFVSFLIISQINRYIKYNAITDNVKLKIII